MQRRLERWKRGLPRLAARWDPAAYILWTGLWTLASARTFYGYMLKQTRGVWSAPLDDVFIHFDYARSTALGHPFEWVVGNGYSSGNTSLSYPFVLAAGYVLGFTDERLMVWAALVATTSVFATLLVARRLVTLGGTWADSAASYLSAPVFFSIGALEWSLWSGMEVAFFLFTWSVALAAYLARDRAKPGAPRRTLDWGLGLAGALMISTRPESIGTLGVFALAVLLRERPKPRAVLGLLARVLGPGALLVVTQSAANRVFTGEWSANGAIVKLAVYNPFMTAAEKLDDYVFNFKYEILRNIEYHFTDDPRLGILLPALGLAALAIPRTRAVALLLWGQIAAWMLLVAFNGQVRWQNERYTMPAVAWLCLAAAVGGGALIQRLGRPRVLGSILLGVLAVQAVIASRLPGERPGPLSGWAASLAFGVVLAALLRFQPSRALVAVLAFCLFEVHEESKRRDQTWFFGRACRNIHDQHVVTGEWLRDVHARRLLVGDAGALVYASGLPGLDIIGLGGYHALPFARAGVQGLSATIELLERLEPEELPDVLAIYPSWWGILPTWFGREVLARTPAVGNVICGGYEDVVYLADWHLLGTGENARVVPKGMTVRDAVDVADLVSESAHGYVFASPTSGFTDLKVLPDPADPAKDLLDGGRELKPGDTETMRFSHLISGRDAVVILRSAPALPVKLAVRAGGEPLPDVEMSKSDGWVEAHMRVPARLVRPDLRFDVTNRGLGDFVDYHAWVAQ